MTAPRFVACKCGHTRAMHPERVEEKCIAVGCECEEYIPSTLDVMQPRSAAVQPMVAVSTVDELLRDARRSSSKRITGLAERIAALVDDLRVKLAEDGVAAKLRAEVAALERQLADKRAQLRGEKPSLSPAPRPTVATGAFPCPDCDRTFSTPNGVGPHRRKVHGFSLGASA